MQSYGRFPYLRGQSVTQLFANLPRSYKIYDPSMSREQRRPWCSLHGDESERHEAIMEALRDDHTYG